MDSRTLVRAIGAPVTIVVAFALVGCDTESLSTNAKASKPIPDKLVAEMDQKNIDKQSPMLVRLFKQEAELEVWKQDRTGRFALLKTYPICRWSGDLGPKIKEGDRQAPEGFYSITPTQMNPQSAYYLSFNMGYPNAFDRALGRTGSQLMVHGDCSSRGCYAMTDEQISEIYALGREAFFGGQRAFQVQAYPFHMTPANFAKHRNSPHVAFWKMLKEGNDYFEITGQEPKVDVCEKHYVFGAEPQPGSSKALTFNPVGACPAYHIPDEIADALRDKHRDDEIKTAELITRGAPMAKLNTGIDGGMHPVFAARVPNGDTGLSEADGNIKPGSLSAAPGTIPPTVNPPHPPESSVASSAIADPYLGVATAPASSPSPRVATYAPPETSSGSSSGGFFGSLARTVGLGGRDKVEAAPPPAPKPTTKPLVAAVRPPAIVPAVKPANSRDQVARELRLTESKDTAPKPPANAQVGTPPAKPDQTIAGAQPVVSSNSFDNRFSFR